MKKQLKNDAKYIRAALVWDSDEEYDCDLDLSAFLLNADGKVRGDLDLIFYNNAFSPEGAFVYGGDNRSGSCGDMDETILARLDFIPADVSRVVFCITLGDEYEGKTFADARHAQFVAKIVSDPYDKDGENLCTVNLSENYAGSTGLTVFELTRSGSGWKYDIACQSVKDGLAGLCGKFGLEVI